MTICTRCGILEAPEPTSLDVDPICDTCARTLPTRPLPEVATIEDCGHDLRHAAKDADGVWACYHPRHMIDNSGAPLLILLDPIGAF